MNAGNIFVLINPNGAIEFAQYVNKQADVDDMERQTISRGTLAFDGTDAEILLAAEYELFFTEQDSPGMRCGVLSHAIEGVARLRSCLAQEQLRPEGPGRTCRTRAAVSAARRS